MLCENSDRYLILFEAKDNRELLITQRHRHVCPSKYTYEICIDDAFT